MGSAKRIGAVLATAGVLASAAFAPPAEAQGHRGPRFVYVRPTSHGWYGYPGFYTPWAYAGFYAPYSPYYGPYFGPSMYPFPPGGGADMNAAAIQGLGAVEMKAKPGSAEVWVDGRFVAEGRDLDGYPSYLWLKEGVHRVVVYKGGYANFDEEIEVRRGVHKELKVKLEKGDGQAPGTRDAKENGKAKS
jgi:hypothetical protein